MKYDDASWHYDGNFPDDLSDDAAATHSGMFLAWAILRGLGGALHVRECPEDAARLRAREVTPGAFLDECCDGKFTDEDLDEEGNAFARAYFDFDSGLFLHDYDRTVGAGLPSLYHVANTWETLDALAPVLDSRLQEWREGRLESAP